MISPQQIQRMIETGSFAKLVDRVLENGRRATPPLRSLLEQPGIAMIAGLGFGLQRMCELTYRPGLSGAMIAARLMKLQRADGLFGSGEHDSPAASAVALRGLIAWRDLLQSAPRQDDSSEPDEVLSRLSAAIDFGIHALAAIESRAGLNEVEQSALNWQLGRELAHARSQPGRTRRSRAAAA